MLPPFQRSALTHSSYSNLDIRVGEGRRAEAAENRTFLDSVSQCKECFVYLTCKPDLVTRVAVSLCDCGQGWK